MTHDFRAALECAGNFSRYSLTFNSEEQRDTAREALRIMTEVQEGRAKIVPITATKIMTDNAMLYADFTKRRSYWLKAYKAMLAAAPDVNGKEGA